MDIFMRLVVRYYRENLKLGKDKNRIFCKNVIDKCR